MPKEHLSFHDEITRNKIKSVALMIVVIFIIVALGFIIAQILDPSFFFIIMIIAVIFSLAYTLFSYYNSDKIALASVKAKPASSTEHRDFYNSAESMALASGLPMPKLYVMESSEINAFASGRDPKNAVICVTSGALHKLDKQELEGVIAHEMGHIANFDIRFMTLTVVLVGMISIIAQIFLRSLWFASLSGGGRSRDGRAQIFLIILGIIFAILAPIVAHLVYMAISRKREYTADATGVKFTRYPPGLSNALKKIKQEHVTSQEKHKFAKAMAPLFISNPFKAKASSLFATHPPIDERIRRLEAM
jgi:heat shock protein HtpX